MTATTILDPKAPAKTPEILRAGNLELRLAGSEAEIAAAQRLRFQVFHEEMGARTTQQAEAAGRDLDDYDPYCDHLLVIDHAEPARPAVVGTYRLLRQEVAARHFGFYSAGEFDLGPLLSGSAGGRQLLELGRSCVDPAHRNPLTINLLWRGIASYLADHGISHMFGCGSLHGADPAQHAEALAYLHHHHLAPPDLRAYAYVGSERVDTGTLPPGSYDAKAASRSLPPLVKGYLRVGAMIGDGAYLDRVFNTTDVFVIMPVDRITERYAGRYLNADA
ncbi:MAG: GNAT family N-acyltransferase [Sphingomonadaceae bacterium]|nr:GNAT family N-acyltransferase [Sphingomonadaceae bacterium]